MFTTIRTDYVDATKCYYVYHHVSIKARQKQTLYSFVRQSLLVLPFERAHDRRSAREGALVRREDRHFTACYVKAGSDGDKHRNPEI